MISTVTALRRAKDDTDDGYGDEYRVPPGTYSACVIDARTQLYRFGRAAKVVLSFQLLDQGPHFGKVISGYYAVRQLTDKPRKNGRFVVGPRSKLVRHLSYVLNDRPPMDHVPMNELSSVILEIELRQVKAADGHALAKSAQYVTVDRIIRRLDG